MKKFRIFTSDAIRPIVSPSVSLHNRIAFPVLRNVRLECLCRPVSQAPDLFGRWMARHICRLSAMGRSSEEDAEMGR